MPEHVSRGIAIGALVFSSACASTGALEEEMSRMRRELVEMKKQLAANELAVQRLEGQVTVLSVGREAVDRAPTTRVASGENIEPRDVADKKKPSTVTKTAAVPARDRVLPVVRLGGKAEAQTRTDDAAWVDPGAIDDGSPPLVIQMGPEDGSRDRLEVDHDVLEKPDPVLGTGKKIARPVSSAPVAKESTPKTASVAQRAESTALPPPSPQEATSAEIESEYQAALTKLRGDSKPAEALAMFELFRVNHPRSNLADNAAYWIGECHYALHDYDRAIATFDALVKEHPRSPKLADAMLRIAESYIALGQKKKAESKFDQLIKAFPKSEAAQSARAKLDSLTSNGGR